MKTFVNDNKKVLILIYLTFIISTAYSQTTDYLGYTYQAHVVSGIYLWGPASNSKINAWSLDNGQANSNKFLSQPNLSSGNYACNVCEQSTVSNYNDWYLPALGELEQIMQNSSAVGITLTNTSYYWSSTEYYAPFSTSLTPTQAVTINYNTSSPNSPFNETASSKNVGASIICVRRVLNGNNPMLQSQYNGFNYEVYPVDNCLRAQWSPNNNYNPNTNDDNGYYNTQNIVNNVGTLPFYAAKVCEELNIQNAYNHSDWYLPSINEVDNLFTDFFNNSNPINAKYTTLESTKNYWSSTDVFTNSSKAKSFQLGTSIAGYIDSTSILIMKNSKYRCRCVRGGPLNVKINAIHPTCNLSSNGSVTANPIGGIAPYSYQWNDSNNSTTSTVSNLPIGTYNVTVTDANNNIVSNTITLAPQSNFIVTGLQLKHETNIGTNDGGIKFSVLGGTVPYTINVTNGSGYSQTLNSSNTNNQVLNLTTGSYNVLVTGSSGCTTTTNISVTNTPNIFYASSGDWHNPSTWNGGHIPTIYDSVVISGTVFNNSPAYCLGMGLSGDLTNNDTLHIRGNLEIVSNVTATTMNVNIGRDFINNYTFIIADNSNNIKIGGNFINNDRMQFWVNDTIFIDGDLINNDKSGYHYSYYNINWWEHRSSNRGTYNIKGDLENTGIHFKSNVIFSNLINEQTIKGGNYKSTFIAADTLVNIELSENISIGIFYNNIGYSGASYVIEYGSINIIGPYQNRATLNLNGYNIAASIENMNLVSPMNTITLTVHSFNNVGVYIPKVKLYNVSLTNCDLMVDTLFLKASPQSGNVYSTYVDGGSITANNIRVNYGFHNKISTSLINANSIDIMTGAMVTLDSVTALLGLLNNYGSLSIKGTVSIENDFLNKGSTSLAGSFSPQSSLITDVTVKGSFFNTQTSAISSGTYGHAFKIKKDIVLFSDINCEVSLTGDSTQYIMGQGNISSLKLINDTILFNASPQWRRENQVLIGEVFDSLIIPNFHPNSSSNPYSIYQCFTQNGLSREFHVIHGTRVAHNNDFYVGIEAFDGGCDSVSGTINLHPVGGISPYLYNWNNISGNYTGNSPSNLQSNTYNVTVTDQTNNTINTSAAINSNLTINTTDVTCAGGSNGMASIILNNGFTTYLANWGGVTPNTLSAGNYSVTVSNNNCSISENYTISDPSGLSPTINITSSDVTCFGDSNGSATINIIPNTPVQTLYSNTQFIGSSDGDMHFSFNTGNLNQDLTLVIKGRGPHGQSTNYLTIYDENDNIIATNILQYGTSCSNSYDTIILNSNDIVGWTSDSILNFKVIASYYYYGYNLPSSCNSYEITLDITDSWTHPTYIWSNGQNTATANNLSVGNYSVTATNSSGCPILRNVTIGSPTAAPKPTITQINSFTLESSPALTYKWYFKGGIPTGSTTQTITPLVSEEYVVEVGYANGCIEQSDPFYFIKVNTSSFLSEENKLIIAPNPNKGQFEIIVESLPFGEWEMSIFSITGQLIHSEKINILKANTSIPIDIENVEEGMYILRIKNKESQIIRRKFMIRD